MLYFLIFLFVVALIYEFWKFFSIIALIVFIYYIGKLLIQNLAEHRAEQRAELERKQKEEADRIQREKDKVHAAQQKQARFLGTMKELCRDSLSVFAEMPRHLMTAEELLDQAEVDFQDTAFAPFWDTVEQAANKLGEYDSSIKRISENADQHKTTSKRYNGESPFFPINPHSVDAMKVADQTYARLKTLVRRAQSDINFAMIYQQRKTNQLLVTGFNSLNEAVAGMGRRISASIDDLGNEVQFLSKSMGSMSDKLEVVGQVVAKGFDNLETSIHDQSRAQASNYEEYSKRHDKALEMLESIQHRRKP